MPGSREILITRAGDRVKRENPDFMMKKQVSLAHCGRLDMYVNLATLFNIEATIKILFVCCCRLMNRTGGPVGREFFFLARQCFSCTNKKP